jgi:hypothetical protein
LLPLEDIDVARSRGLEFSVARKANRGAPWKTVFSVDCLQTALDRARAEEDYEVAIFLETRLGGFIYWTSKHPDVFNSSVLLQIDQS